MPIRSQPNRKIGKRLRHAYPNSQEMCEKVLSLIRNKGTHNETLPALLRMAKLKRLTVPSVGVVVVTGGCPLHICDDSLSCTWDLYNFLYLCYTLMKRVLKIF